MYLHFENWTVPLFLQSLDNRKITHGGKLFKAIASQENPRLLFAKPELYIVESSGIPFTDEEFDMGRRGIFTGADIEDELKSKNITEAGKQMVRALLRFSTLKETQFTQTSMLLHVEGRYLIDSPLGDIDGLSYAASPNVGYEGRIHLDIFEPESLRRLNKIIDLENPAAFVTFQERRDFQRAEGNLIRGLERE